MRIGRYEILEELGAGGMGKVRLAATQNGQVVVVKSPLTDDREDDERLRDEARVGLRLQHPAVVETLDLFEHEGRPHLVVAYVSGASLLELRRKRPLPPAVVCRIGRQIADALDALHAATDENGRPLRILHRDVTPGNVLLGHDGNARLIDLGIARSVESRAERTKTGHVRGTVRYLAPELYDNQEHSPQSDLWALGVVLWEALLGRPSTRGSEAECVGKILSGKVMLKDEGESPDPRVERAIAQLVSKDIAARPRRARDAAAMFGMLEKELGEAGELAAGCVASAFGEPKTWSDEQGRRALKENAASTFAASIPMFPTGFVEIDSSELQLPPLPHATPKPAPVVVDETAPYPYAPAAAVQLRKYAALLQEIERTPSPWSEATTQKGVARRSR